MFNNIGLKIKTCAVVITIVGIVISIIWGIQVSKTDLVSGLLIVIVGCLSSWIGSFLLYGFGELIEKLTNIEKQIKKGVNVKIDSTKQ